MNNSEILTILDQVKEGKLTPEAAQILLSGDQSAAVDGSDSAGSCSVRAGDCGEDSHGRQGFEEVGGFAKLDTDRKERTGFAEVIFCSGKPDDFLVSIYQKMAASEGRVMGTRASKEQYELVRAVIPEVTYDPVSRILKYDPDPVEQTGLVAVVSAGTADIPVAEEAAQTAEFMGAKVARVYDVGVSGLHRLLASTERIREANCVVAVAGMEGALASVVGGLVKNPVIAVPTSVGYGANLHGISALLTMINSCANGISVVNIDNGYGAGYIATQINRLGVSGSGNGSIEA